MSRITINHHNTSTVEKPRANANRHRWAHAARGFPRPRTLLSLFGGPYRGSVLAIDIGATRVRVAVIGENGTILWRESLRTLGKNGPPRPVGRLGGSSA